MRYALCIETSFKNPTTPWRATQSFSRKSFLRFQDFKRAQKIAHMTFWSMLNMYKGRLDVFCSILIIKSLLRRSSRFCILHFVILYFFRALQYNFSLSKIVQRLCSRMFEGFVFDGHIVIASGKNAPECTFALPQLLRMPSNKTSVPCWTLQV